MKRILDIAIAFLVLCVTAPLWVGVALAVLFGSGPPVLYRGVRVGRYGQPFSIFKFRSMRAGRDDDPAGHVATGDPRITRIGHLLRKTKLDEWPQWWNVLSGTMSLVGPRPMTAEEVAEWPAPVAAEILSVRPGLIDWATLAFVDEGDQLAGVADPKAHYREQIRPRKLSLARHYVRHAAWQQDPRILLEACRLIVATRLLRRAYAPSLPTPDLVTMP